MEGKVAKPYGFAWRSHSLFALTTIGIGMFSDLFLYGLMVPILPAILEENIGIPKERHQLFVSHLLSSFATASVIFSPLAGILTDKAKTRRMPFLGGLLALILATILQFTARTMPLLTLARILQGASTAMVWTVGLALCRDTVGSKNLGTTIGSIFGFVAIATVMGPVAGGFLYSKFGIGAVAALALGLLCIDFVMRVLVIEKGIATEYLKTNRSSPDSANEDTDVSHDTETTTLLPSSHAVNDDDAYFIPDGQPYFIQQVPILYCFRAPSLTLSLFLTLFLGIILGSFDATIPLHARTLFGFKSLESGLLFAPIGICNLITGPIGGWAVDRWGTRLVATTGYVLMVPVLIALRIPESEPRIEQIALYAVILAFAGIALGFIDCPAIVEAGLCIERYHERNPDFFGPNGPYAQMYGLSNMMFCFGLGIGPLLAGGLRLRIGYGNMNAVLAGCSAVVAVMCSIWLGRKPNR